MPSEPKHRTDQNAKRLVDDHQKQGGGDGKKDYQRRRDQRFTSCGPDDTCGFRAHLLNEFKCVGHLRLSRKDGPSAQKHQRRVTSRLRATKKVPTALCGLPQSENVTSSFWRIYLKTPAEGRPIGNRDHFKAQETNRLIAYVCNLGRARADPLRKRGQRKPFDFLA